MLKKRNKLLIKIATRNIQFNKLKSAFTIISIMISAFIFNFMILYMLQTKNENTLDIAERYQVAFMGMDEDTVSILKEDLDVDKLGLAFPMEERVENDYSIYPTYLDEPMLSLSKIKLTGEMPQKANEIAIEKDYLKHMNSSADIGDGIILDLDKTGPRDYVITGFVDNGVKDNNYLCIVSDTYLKEQIGEKKLAYFAYLRLKNYEEAYPENLKDKIYKLGEKYNIDKSRISFSSYYFNALSTHSFQYFSLISVVGIIISVACFLVIYCVFYISVVNKVKLYGQFKMLGVTKIQIRKLVKYEAEILIFYSLPIGIILSALTAYIVKPLGWRFLYVIMAAVITTFFILTIVLISVRAPMILASKVSPIDAGKYAGQLKISKVNTKYRKLNICRLAWIDFIQNKKKFSLSILSLAFCGIIFLSIASFSNSISPRDIAKKSFVLGEFKITLHSGDFKSISYNPIDDTLIKEIEAIAGVEKVTVLQSHKANAILPNGKSMDNMVDGISEYEVDKMVPYVIEGEINYTDMMEGNKIIVAGTRILKELFDWNVKAGDKIQIRFANHDQAEWYTIVAVMNGNYRSMNGIFYIPAQKLIRLAETNCNNEINIKAVDYTDKMLRLNLQSIVDRHSAMKLECLEDEIIDVKIQLNQYMVPIYSLVAIIGGFGIINLINTLSSSILTRKQELSIMQSIGLSKKQVSHMLYMNAGVLIIISLLIIVTIGSAAGYLICYNFQRNGLEVLYYKYPYTYLIIYSFILFAIEYIITNVLINKLTREPLTDRIHMK